MRLMSRIVALIAAGRVAMGIFRRVYRVVERARVRRRIQVMAR
jgi:hypothetical protein